MKALKGALKNNISTMAQKNITSGIEAIKEIQTCYHNADTPEKEEAAKKRQYEIQDALSPDELKALNQAAIDDAHAEIARIDEWIAEAADEKMRKKLGTIPEAISISYIAKTYFGKSRSWLLQRINGNKVNGKTVCFSQDERMQLQNALHDLGNRLSSVAL